MSAPSPPLGVSTAAAELIERGFVHLRGTHASLALAWRTARDIFAAAAPHDAIGADMPGLEVVGEFTLPPPDVACRDFQTLHIDFGLPIESGRAVDVARFTALHVEIDRPPTSARTRLVPLRALLRRRAWVEPQTLQARLRRYGSTRDGDDYVEGILARLVEAADGSPSLPAADAPGFLCGLEFASAADERAHLSARGLELDGVEHQVLLGPGELLLFDNLATAHGRLGFRAPLELRQLCVGYARLDPPRQQALLRRVLAAFAPGDERRRH